MKKEDFMQIVRSKAKETLTEQDVNFFAGIGEAVESAFNAETVERNKQIKAITEKLGTVDDGETFSEIIRNLSAAVDKVGKQLETQSYRWREVQTEINA